LKAPPGQAIITNKNRELTSLIIYAVWKQGMERLDIAQIAFVEK